MKKQKHNDGWDANWAKAKKVCRLNMQTIQMAKELGFSPRSLMKCVPSRHQQWKAPVSVFVRDLYERRFPEKAAKLRAAAHPPQREPRATQREFNPPWDSDMAWATFPPGRPTDDHANLHHGGDRDLPF